MLKIIGERGSGKTMRLIEHAHYHGCILVEPTIHQADFACKLAKMRGFDDVTVISIFDMMKHRIDVDSKAEYLIDEIDECFKNLGVVGYSETPTENKVNFTEVICRNKT